MLIVYVYMCITCVAMKSVLVRTFLTVFMSGWWWHNYGNICFLQLDLNDVDYVYHKQKQLTATVYRKHDSDCRHAAGRWLEGKQTGCGLFLVQSGSRVRKGIG